MKASTVRVGAPLPASARSIARLAGLVVAATLAGGVFGTAFAAEDHDPPKQVDFSFEGPFGKFDRAALQRGYQVYTEVCATCHSLNLLAYRNLGDEGGPGFSEGQVKAMAAAKQVAGDPDKDGNPTQRPAKPSDRFVAPFANEMAARSANNGALPPDLSLLAKAREHGAHYVYSVLAGYQEPPQGYQVRDGLHYNPYFPSRQIAMPPPLNADGVTFADGTKASVEQMAHDVSTFLAWVAEPKMEARKSTGFAVVIYLLIFVGLLYFSYRRVWATQH